MEYDYGLDYGDIQEDHESYYYGGEDEGNPVSEMSLGQVYDLCVKPTINSTVKSVSLVFFWCFVYRLSIMFIKTPSLSPHVISFLTGLLSLHFMFSTSIYYIIFLALFGYFLLFLTTYLQYEKYRSLVLVLASLCYLCVCELWLVDLIKWHRIRGPQMIIVMKLISLGFDLDGGKVKKVPNFIYYAGYVLCPNSCIFGPWISFNQYNLNYEENWSLKSIKEIIIKAFLAFFFLTVSTCWSGYFIPASNWKWFAAYRDAFSFRSSHYFISYLSEVTLLLCGHSGSVTNPISVEFPRSLVSVVVYWNLPMHNWLKTYIFNAGRKFGNFFAIFSTYAVSSLLHGLSFQLSAVLFSLGIYSYVEVVLRKKLAGAFNACILAKSCKSECGHKHKKYHPLVVLCNGTLVALTIFHLAYLGVVFDSSQEEETGYTWRHGLKKWADLDFLSHYVAFLTYVMYFLIK